MNAADLEAAIWTAHAAKDEAALARLYGAAANLAEGRGDWAETRFFLTQAYVFALCAGVSEAGTFNRRLAALGAEVIQDDLP